MAEAHELAADGGPLGPGEFLPDAVGGELVVAPAADLVGVGAGEDLDHVVHPRAEPAGLPDAVNAGEKLLGGERAVVGGARLEAVVTGAAGGGWEFLPEVLQQFDPAAGGALG